MIQVGISPVKFAALEKGSIAAAPLFQPLAQEAVAQGFPELADYKHLGGYPPIVYVVNRHWAARNDSGKRLAHALVIAHDGSSTPPIAWPRSRS